MMDRVAGADESYLLAERLFGWTAPIQYTWVFAEAPEQEALERFTAELSAGSLSRMVVDATVPFARDRWVRSPFAPALEIAEKPIPDSEIGAWVDARLRSAELDPAGGRGWRLAGVPTTSGKFVLSLLISHMVADGQGLYNALAAAHSGKSASSLARDSDIRGWRRLREDLADSWGQLGAAISAGRVIAGELRRQQRRPAPPVRDVDTVAPGADADTTLAIVDVDRESWHARARELGGTGNSLFTAVLAGLVQRSGYPTGDQTRVCIAVSRRTEGDERANASGGVWIRLPGKLSADDGLQKIRALSKQAFVDYESAGADKIGENLQPVVRLLPKRLIRRLMMSVTGPDTTVSNLGTAPAGAVEIAGRRAESFAIRAIMQGRSAAERRRQGPAVAAWAVEYDDKITITFFGIHPDHFGDAEQLRKHIDAELGAWGLSARNW